MALPFTTGITPARVNREINGISYTYVLTTSGNYTFPGFSRICHVGTNAVVRLIITGPVSLTGQDRIDIAPGNGSLTIYMAGGSFSAANQAGINNYTGNPAKVFLYGTPTCTNITFGGSAGHTATVYAPSADFTLANSGSNMIHVSGGGVAKSVTIKGAMGFHFDENLRRIGPWR